MNLAEENEKQKQSRAEDQARIKKQKENIETYILWDVYLAREINIDVAMGIKHLTKRAIIFSDSFFKQKIIDVIDDSPYFTDEEKLAKKQSLGMQDAVLRVREETEREKTRRNLVTSMRRAKFKKDTFSDGDGSHELEKLIECGAYSSESITEDQEEETKNTLQEFFYEKNSILDDTQQKDVRLEDLFRQFINWIFEQRQDRLHGYDYDR